MLPYLKILLLFSIQYLTVKCLIQNLSVRKFDRNLIERKRMDTLEMCRIFNEENQKIKRHLPKIIKSQNITRARRVKRDVPGSVLSVDDIQRVESIVDKIYDDMENNGEHVDYRHKNLENLTTTKANSLTTKLSRRFDFAPEMMSGSISNKTDEKPNREEAQAHALPWPKKWDNGIVPYFIDSKTYDSHLAEVITKAFEYFEKATCIRLQRLRERPMDVASLWKVEWLYISNPSGIRQCVHSNDKKINKGVQMVIFGYDCLSLGEIVHELMHVLGFPHEHTRPDRDQHITILWDNIKPGYKKYFEVQRTEDSLLTLPYDYSSVLHYPPRAFSKNGQVTIQSKQGAKIGQREGLSEIDVEKVEMIFGSQCMYRNQHYLIFTCPSVIKSDTKVEKASQKDIEDYFKDRLWPYGIINYKIRDRIEFSTEEMENIKAVIRHIEKETCLEFRDLTDQDNDENDEQKGEDSSNERVQAGNETVAVEEDDKQIIIAENAPEGNDVKDADALISHSKEAILKENTISEEGNPQVNEVLNKFTNSSFKVKSLFFAPNSKPSPVRRTETESNREMSNVTTFNTNSSKGVSTNKSQDRIKRNSGVNVTEALEAKLKPIKRVKRVRRDTPASPSRRHAESILVLTRSPEPGCKCPPPGKPKGDTVLEINADCFNSVNDLLHLFVHLLGLDHQHNMHDRDSYIFINKNGLSEDIKKDMEPKLPPAAAAGFPYDYQSVMHYPWLQIKQGITNIIYPIWNDGWVMGHWQGLSSTDVSKLNLLYFDQCLKRKKLAGADTSVRKAP